MSHLLRLIEASPYGVWVDLALLVVSLALIFAGRTLIKVLAFLVVGFAGATLGALIGGSYLGFAGLLVGGVLGFLLGGLLGHLLLPVGIGFALGLLAFTTAQAFTRSASLSLIVGLAFTVVGILLSNDILALISSVLGGLLLFNVLMSLGFPPVPAALLSAGLSIAGLILQNGLLLKTKPISRAAV